MLQLEPLGALLRWYRAEGRELPWRSEPTPYRILLSELMCQQTRVETAVPYFERFLARWPSMREFAAAEEEAVVEAWAGLGYYSRARNLHRAAVAAVARGGLPSDPKELRTLPGIGPYTAGAIASIAFGVRAPAVDGNIQRVLSRVSRIEEPVDRGPGARALMALAVDIHDRNTGHPGDLNQALMELGARVCTPRNPSCPTCPLRGGCLSADSEDVMTFPRKRPRTKAKRMEGRVAIVVQDGEVLLFQREGSGLLGGLWTPPWAMAEPGVPPAQLRDAALVGTGLVAFSHERIGTFRHVFSHRDVSLVVERLEVTGEPTPTGSWTDWRRGGTGGVSRLASKALEVMGAAEADPQISLLAADAVRRDR